MLDVPLVSATLRAGSSELFAWPFSMLLETFDALVVLRTETEDMSGGWLPLSKGDLKKTYFLLGFQKSVNLLYEIVLVGICGKNDP